MMCRLPDGTQHFIEVKSSVTAARYFDMSVAELQHASKCRKHYTIIRLCGVGTNLEIDRINDPVSKIEQGLIRNCVHLPPAPKAA